MSATRSPLRAHGGRNASRRRRGAVDGLFDRFHGEVRVSLVHRLEEGNFRVPREEHILGSIGHELHKSASHCVVVVVPYAEKKFRLGDPHSTQHRLVEGKFMIFREGHVQKFGGLKRIEQTQLQNVY